MIVSPWGQAVRMVCVHPAASDDLREALAASGGGQHTKVRRCRLIL